MALRKGAGQPDELGRNMTANVTGHSGRRWLRFGANFARLFITVVRKALARLKAGQFLVQ
jgi:hypothetical protein